MMQTQKYTKKSKISINVRFIFLWLQIARCHIVYDKASAAFVDSSCRMDVNCVQVVLGNSVRENLCKVFCYFFRKK